MTSSSTSLSTYRFTFRALAAASRMNKAPRPRTRRMIGAPFGLLPIESRPFYRLCRAPREKTVLTFPAFTEPVQCNHLRPVLVHQGETVHEAYCLAGGVGRAR